MNSRIIPCPYAQTKDTQVQKLADLKEMYALTKSQNIKSLLLMAENLIILHYGSVDEIMKRVKQVVNPTMEEKTFFPKLKKVLLMKNTYAS